MKGETTCYLRTQEEKHRSPEEEGKMWRNTKTAIWKEQDGDTREKVGKSSAEVGGCFGGGRDMLR